MPIINGSADAAAMASSAVQFLPEYLIEIRSGLLFLLFLSMEWDSDSLVILPWLIFFIKFPSLHSRGDSILHFYHLDTFCGSLFYLIVWYFRAFTSRCLWYTCHQWIVDIETISSRAEISVWYIQKSSSPVLVDLYKSLHLVWSCSDISLSNNKNFKFPLFLQIFFS